MRNCAITHPLHLELETATIMQSPYLPDLTGSLVNEKDIGEGPTSPTNPAPGAGTSEANQAHPGPSLLSSAQCQGVLFRVSSFMSCMRDTVEPSVHSL
jgi:hypothetical protein